MSDKIFIDGFSLNEKHLEKAPWVKAQIGIKLDKFIAFAQQHVDERGWLNITIKESKSGSWYAELDTWKRDALEKPEAFKQWQPDPQTPEQIAEMQNRPRIDYPTEEVEESPF